MKKAILLAIMVFCTNVVSSADWSNPKGDGYKFKITDCGKDCMEVRTKNNTLRIYSCGKVDKLDWKEINPNEDSLGISSWPGTVGTSNVMVTAYEDRADALRECPGGVHEVGGFWVCD